MFVMQNRFAENTPGKISVDDELAKDAVAGHKAQPQLHQARQTGERA